MAIHEALLASGLIAGSAVGGELYQRFSMSAVGYFCIALIALAILFQIVLVRLLRNGRR
jgi:predicted MFS family arabinose efflux permease